MRKYAFTSFLVFAAFVLHGSVLSQTYNVKNNGGSRVSFVSDAPLETITGVNSNLRGQIHINQENLKASTGKIEVAVASLKTGIDLRDEHLRGPNWLDGEKYPYIVFEITGLEGATTLTPNETTKLKVNGKITLHGVTKEITANAKIRILPFNAELAQTPGITNDVMRVRARFKIKLSDFGIPVPTIVKLKVSNEIFCTVNLRAIKADAPANK